MKGYELLLRELRKIRADLKVGDLMTTAVKTISPNARMSEAIRRMKKHEVHGLVVVDDKKKPVGIVTNYDTLLVMAKGEDGESTLVKDVMSSDLISTRPDDNILGAMEVMLDHQITKLPVVENEELVGMLIATDLVDAFDRVFAKVKPKDVSRCRRIALTIKDVMREPIIIDPELAVFDAAKIMAKNEISSVLVTKGGICGILTEKDIFKKVVAEGLDSRKTKVMKIMSTPCYIIEPDACISDASKLFSKHNIRRLPVVKDNEIVGMVSAVDIAKTIVMRRQL
jgi:CBS domain-containing protein